MPLTFIGCVVKLAIPGDLRHNVQWCGATQSAYYSGVRDRLSDEGIAYYPHPHCDLFIGAETPQHM